MQSSLFLSHAQYLFFFVRSATCSTTLSMTLIPRALSMVNPFSASPHRSRLGLASAGSVLSSLLISENPGPSWAGHKPCWVIARIGSGGLLTSDTFESLG